MYDVCIIGAGVVGCNISRELSKYNLNICVLEKENDVSCGASKANSGIVHGGFAEKHGTLKAKLCVEGKKMYKSLQEELNFGYRNQHSLVIAFTEEEMEKLKELYENGIKNGVEEMEIIDGKRVRKLEPNINEEVIGALYCKSSGVTSPYEFTIALAENSIENGVDIKLESEVKAIDKIESGFLVKTDKETIECRYVVNAAGVYSDKIAKMVGADNFYIIPRRGQYILFDKGEGELSKNVIFQVPTKEGKGILVTRTYHGNLMIGPNAEEVTNRENVETTEETLKYIVKTARKSIPSFNTKKIITSFSGIRATSDKRDFIIEESKKKGFINVSGIESPGLTSSPAIALMVVDILKNGGLNLEKKDNFNPYRRPIIIKKDESFNGEHIICRCEKVTEEEIIDALNRGIKVKSIEGIKRRTRAGMGRCQGNYCGPRVRAIIARELNISEDEVLKKENRLPRSFYKDL